MQIANVGKDVWIGDTAACNLRGTQFPNIIHIWYENGLDRRCNCVAHLQADKNNGLRPGDIAIRYLDGQSLTMASMTIDEIARYSCCNGPILIHCVGGTYRSPTLAMIALVVRGMDVFDAMASIQRAAFTQYEVPRAVHFHNVPVLEIFEWASRLTATHSASEGYGSRCRQEPTH
jgi:hypothetical protein